MTATAHQLACQHLTPLLSHARAAISLIGYRTLARQSPPPATPVAVIVHRPAFSRARQNELRPRIHAIPRPLDLYHNLNDNR